ncbi:hypothetical protein ACOME3_009539 [Neoechinorhynchus agilis]
MNNMAANGHPTRVRNRDQTRSSNSIGVVSNMADQVLSRCLGPTGVSGDLNMRFHHPVITDPYCMPVDTDHMNGNSSMAHCAQQHTNIQQQQQQQHTLHRQQQCPNTQEQRVLIGYYQPNHAPKYPPHDSYEQHMIVHQNVGAPNTWIRLSQQPPQCPAYFNRTSLHSKSGIIFPSNGIGNNNPNSPIPMSHQQQQQSLLHHRQHEQHLHLIHQLDRSLGVRAETSGGASGLVGTVNVGKNGVMIESGHSQVRSSANEEFDWFMRQCSDSEIPTTTSVTQPLGNEHDSSHTFDQYYLTPTHQLHQSNSCNGAASLDEIPSSVVAVDRQDQMLSSTSPGTKRSADNDVSQCSDLSADDAGEEQDCMRLKMMLDNQPGEMSSPSIVSGRNSRDFSTSPIGERAKRRVLEESGGSGRTRNVETYFWQYNVQAKGPKTKRTLHLKNKDPHVPRAFFDPVCQMKAKLGARGTASSASLKLRKGDGNDVTPNPQKLLLLGMQIKQLTEASYRMTPSGTEHKECLKREKNKLASRSCRLKKKAQHEANKLKLQGLNEEHSTLSLISYLSVIYGISLVSQVSC